MHICEYVVCIFVHIFCILLYGIYQSLGEALRWPVQGTLYLCIFFAYYYIIIWYLPEPRRGPTLACAGDIAIPMQVKTHFKWNLSVNEWNKIL